MLITFLALGAALIAARAAGEAAGWGFQLQSPPLVAALTLLMLLIALNLSGVFQIGASAQGVGAGLAGRSGVAGAFFTGVLAVVVAAPCTAPFMAAALGYALVQPAAAALAIFLALGLGLAAPFVLVSFTPALLRRLPRPGPWMRRCSGCWPSDVRCGGLAAWILRARPAWRACRTVRRRLAGGARRLAVRAQQRSVRPLVFRWLGDGRPAGAPGWRGRLGRAGADPGRAPSPRRPTRRSAGALRAESRRCS